MAAGQLPAPGTMFGPCEEACDHIDCKLTRTEARTPCGICWEPIGYDTRFYHDDALGKVHAVCLEDHVFDSG